MKDNVVTHPLTHLLTHPLAHPLSLSPSSPHSSLLPLSLIPSSPCCGDIIFKYLLFLFVVSLLCNCLTQVKLIEGNFNLWENHTLPITHMYCLYG